ncbi:uncharacterized protein LOC121315200 [Polyodon spathula]|uniref:uncharacterized protein LOC121315200 n=1 Tax=Polyodon spathula TaxID=7913 RepID=UPI001B7D9A05|nr:uncharacterized protein LOC121315200 [Polyodon spathula]
MVDREQDYTFIGGRPQCVSDIAAELRNDYYSKLQDVFLGTAKGNNQNTLLVPHNNRMLLQIGLLKEENQVAWKYVQDWLEALFPKYRSARLRSLIEKASVSALRLNAEERAMFLEEEVNLEYVGPVCDSLGIRRTDLLECTDLSEKIPPGDPVTNALLLEWDSFVRKEKIDPSVIVTWLKNFHSQFCSDGNTHKAYKTLQLQIQKIKLDYRMHQKNKYKKNSLFSDFLQAEFIPIPSASEGGVIDGKLWNGGLKKKNFGSKWIANKMRSRKIRNSELANGIADKTYNPPNLHVRGTELYQNRSEILSHHKTEQNLKSQSISGQYPYLTTKPIPQSSPWASQPNGAYCNDAFDQHTSVESKESVNVIHCSEAKEQALTLLDVSILAFQKLSGVYGTETELSNQVFKELLRKHFVLMSDYTNVMKTFNDRVSLCQQGQPGIPSPLHFLGCNAHYLLGLSHAAEKETLSFENEILAVTGEKLGRDKNLKFTNFLNFSESASARYIRMACDVLNPRGEEKFGCRKEWLAFCEANGKASKVPSGRSNRFNSFFEGAAALIHHHVDIVAFFSDEHVLKRLNVVQESVRDDVQDPILQALVCVFAVIYHQVIGPYWQFLKSNTEYLDFHKYIQRLHQKLNEWSLDATPLLLPELGDTNIFHQFLLHEGSFDGLFSYCNPDNPYFTLIKKALEQIMKSFVAVTRRELSDFLPGGVHSKEPMPELRAKMRNCQLAQLMGEYPFGHTYTDKYRKPNNSLNDQGPLHSPSRTSGQTGRHKKRMQLSSREMNPMQEKQLLDISNKTKIIAAVVRNGGPCKTKRDVDYLLSTLEGASHSKKREAIRLQISYQKIVLGLKNKNLTHIGFSLKDMVDKLKSVLAEEKCPQIPVHGNRPAFSHDAHAGPSQRPCEAAPSSGMRSAAQHPLEHCHFENLDKHDMKMCSELPKIEIQSFVYID